MPFGITGRTGPGMRQVVGFGDRSTERSTLGANLGRFIVTSGDFTAYVYTFAAFVRFGHFILMIFAVCSVGRPNAAQISLVIS